MFHIHRWSKWYPHRHYVDSSFGGLAQSTMMLRHCPCGMLKTKGLYGVVLDLENDGDA